MKSFQPGFPDSVFAHSCFSYSDAEAEMSLRHFTITIPAPSGSTAIALQTVVPNLAAPLDLEQPNDGSGRLFVVSQAGTIQIIQNGAVLPIPFLDIRNLVIDSVRVDCWALLSTLDSRRIPAFT